MIANAIDVDHMILNEHESGGHLFDSQKTVSMIKLLLSLL